MTGAEALLRTLVLGGVDVCFANPGTSEMHLVAALDGVPEMRAVLALFEGVATGAADGYARLAGRPAATLLHLGPGLANGLANLHNAGRARVPLVSVVGEHATHHRHLDSPLASDVAGYARQVSSWIRVVAHARTVGTDAAAAIAAAREAPGRIATLIVPTDCSWAEGAAPEAVSPPPAAARVDDATVAGVADALLSGEPAMLLLAGAALTGAALADAGRIAARTGARLACPTFVARLARGAGRVPVERLPYRVSEASRSLAGLRHLVLVGAGPPVAFFAYPGQPSWLTPAATRLATLARPEHDLGDALARLAERVGAAAAPRLQERRSAGLPAGRLDPAAAAQIVAALLPEGCVVVDESVSAHGLVWEATAGAPPHDLLMVTGGAIGQGLPLAVGAAVACPDRRVVAIEGDGSAAYTLQALWTQAREGLDVTTVILANRAYRILEAELRQAVGAGSAPGPRAERLLALRGPELDWVSLARGMGVPASRVETAEALAGSLRAALAARGPALVEAMV